MLTIFGHLGLEVIKLNSQLVVVPGGAALGVAAGALAAGQGVRIIAEAGDICYDFFCRVLNKQNCNTSWIKQGNQTNAFMYDFTTTELNKSLAFEAMTISASAQQYLVETSDVIPVANSLFHVCSNNLKLQHSLVMSLCSRGVHPEYISVSTFLHHIQLETSQYLLQELLENIGLMCMNLKEWKLLNSLQLSQTIFPLILVSKGKEGAFVVNNGSIICEYKAPSVKFVNAVGSGDVLHGAYSASFRKIGIEVALKKAIQIASVSCESYGLLGLLTSAMGELGHDNN